MEIDGFEKDGKKVEKQPGLPKLRRGSDAVQQAYDSLSQGTPDPNSVINTEVSTTYRSSQRGLGFYLHDSEGTSLKNFYVGPARVVRVIGEFAYGFVIDYGFEYHVFNGVAFRLASSDSRLIIPHREFDEETIHNYYYEANDQMATVEQADFLVALCDPKVGTGDLQKLFKTFNPDLERKLTSEGNKLCRNLNGRGIYMTRQPITLPELLNWS